MKSRYLLVVVLILGGTFILVYGNMFVSSRGTYDALTSIRGAQKVHSPDFVSALVGPGANFTSNGVIVPLYSAPGGDWAKVMEEKTDHPLVPILAIVNPQNGPGATQNPVYVNATRQLEIKHIGVLGYVYTQYGNRNSSEIKSEILNYKNWYHADGIFFDEMSSTTGNEGYYKNLGDYAKSVGMKYTVGNPGRDMSPSYVGTMDNIVIYDNPDLPSLSVLAGWHNYTKSNFSIMAFDVGNFDKSYVVNASKYVKYVYLTNGTLPDPWGAMSPYLEDLTSTMQGISSGNQTCVTGQPR